MTAHEVKQIRDRLGLTGDELAELIGVHGGTVRRWECGMRQPSNMAAKTLRRLVDEKPKELQTA